MKKTRSKKSRDTVPLIKSEKTYYSTGAIRTFAGVTHFVNLFLQMAVSGSSFFRWLFWILGDGFFSQVSFIACPGMKAL